VNETATAVAVVEDRKAIRENVALLIQAAAGFRCAGSYASMEEALLEIGPRGPDVVLVDLVLPGMSGVDGIRLLRRRCPEACFVAFTVYDEDERVFDALCAGALGCLPKTTAARALLETLASVAAGAAAPMPANAARRVLEMFRRIPRPEVPPDEIRLLELLAGGHNHETATRELRLSRERVDRLARSVYERLHASFCTESVR
jgi:DNA-binding NarL/FixJ family response regulator